jgi:hypothetical protein
MALKRFFLRIPLNLQIYLSLLLIIIATVLLDISLLEVFTSQHLKYLTSIRKEYFFNMEQSIIESYIFFTNLCLFQYEFLIKTFNYQFYLYLKNDTILMQFALQNMKYINEEKIVYFDPSVDDIPDYNSSISDDQQKIYIYNYLNDPFLKETINFLIKANYLSFLNLLKGVRNFRIPFYGDFPIIEEYVIVLTKYNTMYSLNNSRVKELYLEANGKINEFLFYKSELNYKNIKEIFYKFQNNELHFFNIMYKMRDYIFTKYLEIDDLLEKEEYIKEQSIYLQTIHFENDSTLFFDSWNSKNSRFIGKNNIIADYINFLFFHLSSMTNLYIIPFNHFSYKNILSKKLCYYFLYKQIIQVNITSDNNNNEFNKEFLDKIYNSIFNKEILTIEDCKLETYYSKGRGNQINITKEFPEYYDLNYILDNYMYLLTDKDINSCMFEMKYTYPNLRALKEFCPNSFNFKQIDFYAFSFANEIVKLFISSKEFIVNLRCLSMLLLLFNWLILFIIFSFIIKATINQITKPIFSLTEAINLNYKKNEKYKDLDDSIFEYKLDDDINKFFLLCKKLINGEIKDKKSILKNKDNIEGNNNNQNTNMIINNKMILELIENQKALNNDDKEIYLLKKIDFTEEYVNKKFLSKRTTNLNDKLMIRNRFNLIKMNSVKNNENELLTISDETNSEKDVENRIDSNSLIYYEHLFLFSDFLYNTIERVNNYHNKKKTNKNLNQINSISNKSLFQFGSISNISVNINENEIKNMKRDSKYITYYWYMNAKKSKQFGNFDNIY